MLSYRSYSKSKLVSFWLFFMVFLVVCMILLGGATRLTNSGLSITEWRPISGALPPMSQEHWAQEFQKYQQIPEFLAENPDMNLQGFKFIYFMEWSHRQLGRFIGVAYFLPLILFLGLGKLKHGKRGRFISILILIGIQGAIGWWMVSSGFLKDRVDVSQYRLATHLGLAVIILGFLFWTWLDQRAGWPDTVVRPRLSKRTAFLLVLVFLQIIAGAFVAGTHAGLAYNTWPLMDSGFVPGGYIDMKPVWRNIFENTATIQFNHRLLGYMVFLFAIIVWGAAKKYRETSVSWTSGWLLAAIVFQITLGIVTLLRFVELPYALAHQAGAIMVFLLAVMTVRRTRIR